MAAYEDRRPVKACIGAQGRNKQLALLRYHLVSRFQRRDLQAPPTRNAVQFISGESSTRTITKDLWLSKKDQTSIPFRIHARHGDKARSTCSSPESSYPSPTR